jgi:thiol-disulfide isomerase/thioredoxin
MFMKYIVFILLIPFSLYAQSSLKGVLSAMPNTEIQLLKYEGFNSISISSVISANDGSFNLQFHSDNAAIGYLLTENSKPFIFVLSAENIVLKGKSLSQPETIRIIEGKENQLFGQYALEHPKREQTLSAWDYLLKIYKTDTIFINKKSTIKKIEREINSIKNEDDCFLKKLPENSYVSWYLPMRKLVSSVPIVAQYRTKEIPKTIQAFGQIDYTDNRLYYSGILKEVLESHFWLLENSGTSLENVNHEMKISIDLLLDNLSKDNSKLNEITHYLFDLLERHSLFEASEYLAIKVLNQTSCTIDSNFARQLETYRSMKKGNIAPDIIFDEKATILQNNLSLTKLSDSKASYKLVVFGASWCPKCTEEIPQLAHNYHVWKNKGLNVVYISLDDNKEMFENFASSLPFLSYCDLQKWNSKPVLDYYVFGTPTMFILDQSNKIVLRPNSVKQIEAWINLIENE